MKQNPTETLALLVGITAALCCICILAGALIGFALYPFERGTPVMDWSGFPDIGSDPTAAPELARPPVESIPQDTLATLAATVVPENDPYSLACRLQSVCGVPETLPGRRYALGDTEQFWIINSDTNAHNRITAELMYATPHSYFWVEQGTPVDEAEMRALMETFENQIYPTDREFFGSEWIPGVDGDEHIFVIYARSIGHNIAGYFSSLDSYNPLVREYSNAHETYVLGTSQDLGNPYTYATLAHEFVHMIQFASDRNDVSWINEGFAELGAFINGYDVGGADWLFTQNPDLQLNTWVDNASPDFSAHYGQSFLYLAYFLDRFGEHATQALTNNPENDLASVDDTLAALNITDPGTGRVITADEVFMDWAAALYLLDGNVGDGRYTFHNYPAAPGTTPTESIDTCPTAALTRSVNQYGIDYIEIRCSGEHTLVFRGSTRTGLLPTDPPDGNSVFWSNRGDESDMTLTREFDFSGTAAPIELAYRMWYDLEEDYDYVYLEVSEDGGNSWQILPTPSGTGEDPSGNSYGWGYNAATGGWVEDRVDLSEYAGEKVLIRFEYVTDAAINGEGFLLDEIVVEAIGYAADFETDDGGWQAEGFVRVQNDLPQTFRLALIVRGETTEVRPIPVHTDQTAEVTLSLGPGESATLIVTGTTRFTRQGTTYEVVIE